MASPYEFEETSAEDLTRGWKRNHYVKMGITPPPKKPRHDKPRQWRIEKKRCKYCKVTTDLTYDHKIPKSLGGKNTPKNIQILCKRCNETKSSLTEAQIKSLFKWFLKIQKSRLEHGKKPYTLR